MWNKKTRVTAHEVKREVLQQTVVPTAYYHKLCLRSKTFLHRCIFQYLIWCVKRDFGASRPRTCAHCYLDGEPDIYSMIYICLLLRKLARLLFTHTLDLVLTD